MPPGLSSASPPLVSTGARRGRWRALAALVIVVAGLGFWKREAIVDKVLYLRYGATATLPAGPMPADATQAREQDLAVLAQLAHLDRSFDAASRARFDRDLAALRAAAGSMAPAQFFLGVAHAVAESGNAHTNVDAISWRALLNSVPVRLGWFSDGLYVIAATQQHRSLLGARIERVDGMDSRMLEQEAAGYFAGTARYVRTASPLLIESPQALRVLHPNAPDDRWVADVEDASGVQRRVELPAIDPKEAPAATKPGWLLSPLVASRERPGSWIGVLDGRGVLPPSLRGDPSRVYSTRLADGRTLYLHLWQVRDQAPGSLDAALESALGSAGEPAWQRIVLDLRADAGGDYPTVYPAMKALAHRLAPNGRLVVLVDDTTFSAAIITAVLARHFTAPRAVFMGEPVGDRLAFWAEGTPMVLPRSGMRIGVATGFHDWRDGCRALRCYWPNFVYGVGDGPLAPIVRVPWPFADYRRGVDPVLQRALQ